MAARKRTKRPPKSSSVGKGKKSPERQKPEPAEDCPYLGCFFFDDYLNDKEHTGSFQMVVAACSPEQALDRFRKRLRAIRRIGSVLSGPNTVYLQGLVPLRGPFNEGILVNYESRPLPEPDFQLLNMTPEQGIKKLGSYQLAEDDEEGTQPFVDFGGQAHFLALETAKKTGEGHSFRPMPAKPRLSPEEKAKARSEAATLRARRSAEVEARKREREAAGKVKARRDQALKATLAELGNPRGKSGTREAKA